MKMKLANTVVIVMITPAQVLMLLPVVKTVMIPLMKTLITTHCPSDVYRRISAEGEGATQQLDVPLLLI